MAQFSPAPVTPAVGKPPKGPEKPLVPYMRFSKVMWSRVRAENPGVQLHEIGRIIGEMWRQLPDHEKSQYQAEYDREKVQYDRNMKVFHNSPQYQAWLAQKNQVDSSRSTGHQSATRFDRAHRLMAELLAEQKVADPRNVITQHRMDMLKRQADSLAQHQTRLEGELNELERRFQEKKARLETSRAEFHTQWKKVCSDRPKIDDVQFQEMVSREAERLTASYAQHLSSEKQKQMQAAAKNAEVGLVNAVVATQLPPGGHHMHNGTAPPQVTQLTPLTPGTATQLQPIKRQRNTSPNKRPSKKAQSNTNNTPVVSAVTVGHVGGPGTVPNGGGGQ